MRLLIEDLRGKIVDGSFAVSQSQPMELLPYMRGFSDPFRPANSNHRSTTLPGTCPVGRAWECRCHQSFNRKSREPLSQRELEVLRLFKTELSGPEIARELTIALSTVRTHTESIYSKLNVKTRRAAVQRAIELNLI